MASVVREHEISVARPDPAPAPAPVIDLGRLEAELRAAIRGDLRFDEGGRALYATDSSNYRQLPIGVIWPRDADDIVAAMEIARRHRAPILARGGGTSLAGQACNVAIVIDTTRYFNQVISIDPEQRIARVQTGVILDDLRTATRPHGLTFGPDPATHDHCVLGGMIGNNSCGVHSVMAGKTVDNVLELEILTYEGERMRVGPTSDEEFARIVEAGGRRGEIYAQLRDLRNQYAEQIRAELLNLYPHDIDARRLSGQVFTLGEFLEQQAPDFQPQLRRKALLHGHCHHKSIMHMDHEKALLNRLGVDCQLPRAKAHELVLASPPESGAAQ